MLIYAIAVELGLRHTSALVAAAVVALHPLLIAFSGVLERQPTYLFAAMGSTAALLRFLRRGEGRALVAFVLGVVLAVTTRPEGAHVMVLSMAAILAVVSSARRRVAVAITLAVMAPLAFLYTHHAMELAPPPGRPQVGSTPFLWTILFDTHFTPAAWIAAALCGLALGLRRRATWMVLAALVGFDLLWRWTDLYRMFVFQDRPVTCARYQSILLVPFGIAMALFFEATLRASRGVRVGVFAALAVSSAVTFRAPFETLLRGFTVDDEYRFLTQVARTLPPDAELYVFDAPFDDLGFMDAHQVGKFVASPVKFANWSERRCDAMSNGEVPRYLYLGSSCAEVISTRHHPLQEPDYSRWLSQCGEMRTRLGVAADEAEVRARQMVWHRFREPTVRLDLYRLRDAAVCDHRSAAPRLSPMTPPPSRRRVVAVGGWHRAIRGTSTNGRANGAVGHPSKADGCRSADTHFSRGDAPERQSGQRKMGVRGREGSSQLRCQAALVIVGTGPRLRDATEQGGRPVRGRGAANQDKKWVSVDGGHARDTATRSPQKMKWVSLLGVGLEKNGCPRAGILGSSRYPGVGGFG